MRAAEKVMRAALKGEVKAALKAKGIFSRELKGI